MFPSNEKSKSEKSKNEKQAKDKEVKNGKGKEQEKHGILKKDTGTKKSPGLKWNEDNITATFHPVGKTYGLQKVTEPDTPYPTTKPGVDPEELNKKLKLIDKISDTSKDSKENTGRDSFKKMAKAFYSNEFPRNVPLEDEEDSSSKDSESAKCCTRHALRWLNLVKRKRKK